MGAGSGMVVVMRGGAVRCLPAEAVADLVAGAVTPWRPPTWRTPRPRRADRPAAGGDGDHRPPPPGPGEPARQPLPRAAGWTGRRPPLVLRSRSVPERSRAGVGLSLGRRPAGRRVAVGATFDLIVPVGEPGRRRYPAGS